jgi:hypothetical protein
MPGATQNLGGASPGGYTSSLPLWGSPEQQLADPLHLFPGTPPPNPGAPSVLPNLGIKSRFYDPNSFGARPSGNGMWNAMAAKLAGPMYNPQYAGGTPASGAQPPMGLKALLQSGGFMQGNSPMLNKLAGTRRGF